MYVQTCRKGPVEAVEIVVSLLGVMVVVVSLLGVLVGVIPLMEVLVVVVSLLGVMFVAMYKILMQVHANKLIILYIAGMETERKGHL